MNVLSLFDGISCGRVALERAGIEVDRYDAFEINEKALAVSQYNWPDVIQHGNVIGADFTKFKNVDLLIGGSPCTDLSIAKRNREGLKGEQSKLFWEYVRALKEVKPKYFLFENNYNMPKEDKQVITETLGVEPILINSALVSAQQRKRYYWTNIPNVTQPKDRAIYLNDILYNSRFGPKPNKIYIDPTDDWSGVYEDLSEFVKIKDINKIVWNTNKPIRVGQIGKGGQGERVYSDFGKSVTLSSNGGGGGALVGLYLIGIDGNQVRRPIARECEKLQTLPAGYTNVKYKGRYLSQTERKRLIGNGWTVEVIVHILSFIPKEEN